MKIKNNSGRSLIGIIIVLVIVGLITSGLYYYLQKRILKVSEFIEKSDIKSLSPSEEMRNKFQSTLTEMVLEIVPAFKDEPEFSGKTSQAIAQELSFLFMKEYGDAFVVSNEEAKRFLSEEYDDAKNRKDIERYISEFARAGVELPYFCRYLIQKYYNGELSGLSLEIATRVLKAYLNEIR